jgi:hypothetical protein
MLPWKEHLVYLPEGGSVTLNLRDSRGGSAVEWFVPQVNRTFSGAGHVATTAP